MATMIRSLYRFTVQKLNFPPWSLLTNFLCFHSPSNSTLASKSIRRIKFLSLVTLIFLFLDGVIGIWMRIYTPDTSISTLRPAIKLVLRIH
ncbi:hypothetical protein ANCCEY_06917 [Ancylostoma ceylanicum]|uniref:Uncharacterized protein n=1 Tax=Ancylostoma ceylanicum TaxID=53326 RepID=A0A0D6LS12_9BILA|nr:hypothetical protein ANCCEY_06917 [Ancylostoma ceylanicum]